MESEKRQAPCTPQFNAVSQQELGRGIPTVYTMTFFQGDLYIGGAFQTIGTMNISYVARWDGSNWHGLGPASANGVNSTVWTMEVFQNKLYIGGSFTQTGGNLTSNLLTIWNGTDFSALSIPLTGSYYVRALRTIGSGLWVGGSFGIPSPSSQNLGVWNGSAWQTFGSGVDGMVLTIEANRTDVYIGGTMYGINGQSFTSIAKWDGSTFSSVGSNLDTSVSTILIKGNDLYAAGSFTYTAKYIAKFNGTYWNSLGGGTNSFVNSMDFYGDDLIVGGYFNMAGNVSANSIAKWDGAQWSNPFGDGISLHVQKIRYFAPDLYIIGPIDFADGLLTSGIVRYGCASPTTAVPTPTNSQPTPGAPGAPTPASSINTNGSEKLESFVLFLVFSLMFVMM